MKRYWSFVAVIAAVWLIGLAIYLGVQGDNDAAMGPGAASLQFSPAIGKARPTFELPDLQGNIHTIDEWNGNVVLINFWATWCPPCRREIPGFIEVREQLHSRGFEILGIAIDDSRAVKQYIAEIGVNYPVLVGKADASDVARQLGNGMGALPYSVLVDRDGVVRFAKAGELSPKTLLSEANKYLAAEH